MMEPLFIIKTENGDNIEEDKPLKSDDFLNQTEIEFHIKEEKKCLIKDEIMGDGIFIKEEHIVGDVQEDSIEKEFSGKETEENATDVPKTFQSAKQDTITTLDKHVRGGFKRKNGTEKRKVNSITIELKKEIIAKHEGGVRISDISTQYKMAKSSICTILKNKKAIKAANVAKGVTILTKHRPQIIDEVEKLLLVWMNEKQLAGDYINESLICEKARQLHSDLAKQTPNMSGNGSAVFKASRGWFEKFRKRSDIHSMVGHGEAASLNKQAVDTFVKEFSIFVKDEGYLPQQVFNCDETRLFWKKMPKRTFITKEEKALPGHKPMKDKLTLLLCANASGDFKVKPLLVYHSENPRAFKKNHVLKNKLPVMWRANNKSWVTRLLFIEWVHEVFAPSVKMYLEKNSLPLKCLLIMDNAPAHPPGLEYDFIKVKFLPPTTTLLIQPMDQQVISNFKKLYTKALFARCFQVTNDTDLTLRDFWRNHFNILHSINLIDKAWNEVTYQALNSAWRKLWPDCVQEDFKGSEAVAVEDVMKNIVSMGKSMGLEVDSNDVDELVQDQSEELTTEELLELHTEQQKALVEKQSLEEEEAREKVTSVTIKDICAKWSKLQDFIEQHHPDKVVANRAVNIFNDNVMSHFRKILQQRKKHLTQDRFLVPVKEISKPNAKKQKRERNPDGDLPIVTKGDSPFKQ